MDQKYDQKYLEESVRETNRAMRVAEERAKAATDPEKKQAWGQAAARLKNRALALEPVSAKPESALESGVVQFRRGMQNLKEGFEEKVAEVGRRSPSIPLPYGAQFTTGGADPEGMRRENAEEYGRYKEDYPGFSVAELAGEVAPGIVASALTGPSLLANVALGAGESLLMSPSEKGFADNAKDALIGGGVGFVGHGIPAILGGRIPAVRTPELVQSLQTLIDKNINITPRMMATKGIDKLIETLSETKLFGGESPALKTLKQAQNSVQSQGKLYGGNLQNSYNKQIEVIDGTIEGMYREAFNPLEGKVIPMSKPLLNRMAGLLSEAQRSASTGDTAGHIKRLNAKLQLMNGKSAQEWHDFISQVGESTNFEKSTWATRPMQEVHSTLREYLNESVSRMNPDSGKMLKQADKMHSLKMDLRNTADLSNQYSAEVLQTARNVKSPEAGEAVFRQLTPEGRSDIFGELLTESVQGATHSKKGLNPLTMKSNLTKYRHLYEGAKRAGLDDFVKHYEDAVSMADELSVLKEKSPELFNSIAGIALTGGLSETLPRLLQRNAGVSRVVRNIKQLKEANAPLTALDIERARLWRTTAEAMSSQVPVGAYNTEEKNARADARAAKMQWQQRRRR